MSQSESPTLEWLISTLKWYEELQAKQVTYTDAVLYGSAEAQSRIQTYYDILRVSGDIANAPGKGRIELFCDELPNSDGLTAANVVKLRARVCRTIPCTLEEANLLTLDGAADALDAVKSKTPQSANGTKGRPGRRGYPLEALNYAQKLSAPFHK